MCKNRGFDFHSEHILNKYIKYIGISFISDTHITDLGLVCNNYYLCELCNVKNILQYKYNILYKVYYAVKYTVHSTGNIVFSDAFNNKFRE